MKPRLLDLFCGAGGCGMGYSRAGFEVVGVDSKPQPNYPFEFVQADALTFLEDGTTLFDAVHASPPCQAYTTMNQRWTETRSEHPALISPLRTYLEETDLPYVIENVLGARQEMRNTTLLRGEMFGITVSRPRLFETNWPLMSPPQVIRHKEPVAVYGKLDGRRLWTRADGSELRAVKTLEDASEAMEIDWMTWDELREAVPPVYTEFIGYQLMGHVRRPA